MPKHVEVPDPPRRMPNALRDLLKRRGWLGGELERDNYWTGPPVFSFYLRREGIGLLVAAAFVAGVLTLMIGVWWIAVPIALVLVALGALAHFAGWIRGGDGGA